jgi:hypothetical protein
VISSSVSGHTLAVPEGDSTNFESVSTTIDKTCNYGTTGVTSTVPKYS